jgi:uncharacterized 2Fe-2S/4Fe-4S cluster protein (DUF4445 family)
MEKFKVTFYPDNKTVEVERDRTILSAALSAGVYINSACGGDGVCGRCRVILKKGKVTTQPSASISLKEKEKNIYLACLTAIQSDAEIEVPAESRLDLEKLSDEDIDRRLGGFYAKAEEVEIIDTVSEKKVFQPLPLAQKLFLQLPQPNLDDRISDLERIYRQIYKTKNIEVSHTNLVNMRLLGEMLRSSDWKVTATLGNRSGIYELLEVEPGDTSERNFGLVFDIGTTTVSGQLVDLNSNKVLGTKATYNKQAGFGSDVITRIIYAQKQEGLEKLHNAVIESINEIIHELTAEHKIDLNDVNCCLCAGNTTMIHLLLRIDPSNIRKEPYVPTANFIPVIRAYEAGIKINPRGILYCVSGISSYVGGDVTAGVSSLGLDMKEDLSILIDIGTNGEIVLGNKEFLIATSASAGPAFEGSGVSCGMRSASGAIQKVKISRKDFNISFETIGNAKPRGICGSGYIDILAQMLDAGVLDKDGKIKAVSNKRIRRNETGKEFVIAFKEEADAASDIVITEADIDNIKRAKAAIYSATLILVRHLSIDLGQVKNIFIAGGFGTSLDIESSVRIGLLPDIERSKFRFVGNSSLAGARQMLLSCDQIKRSEETARKMTYFELSVEPGYMDEYVAALFFPHTDLARFPSVRHKG